MKSRHISTTMIATLLLMLGAATAGAQIEDHPGYFPIDRFGILTDDSLTLEINLNQALLRLVAAALGEDEPELAELVGGLESIQVRVAEAGSYDAAQVRSGLGQASDWLKSRDWSTMLRLREDDEEVYVYLRVTEDEMQGLAVLAMEDQGEAVLVNVVGSLDPERLAALAEALNIPQLDMAGLGDGIVEEEERP